MNNDIALVEATEQVEIILYVTCFLCLCLIGVIAAVLVKIIKKQSLSKYQSKAASMADLLNYNVEVEDGIILLKNGGLMRSFMYSGPDESTLDNLHRNMISEQLNNIFKSFDSGWICHIDAIRRPVPNYFDPSKSFFTSKVAQGIDDERRNFFASKESMFSATYIFTVTYLPPKLANRKLAEAMFEKDGSEKRSQLQKQKAIIEEFKIKSNQIYDCLTNIFNDVVPRVVPLVSFEEPQGFNGRSVRYDPLLTYLEFCITGEWNVMQVPANPCNLDDLLAVDTKFGVVPVIDNKYMICVGLDSYPSATTPGIFNILTQFGYQYRWSTRYIGLETHEAASEMKKLRKKWEQKKRGFIAQMFPQLHNPEKDNQDAVAMAAEGYDADSQISRGDITFGYCTSNIVLMHKDLYTLKQQASNVVKVLASMGLKGRIETINNFDAWLGTLPGHGAENVRRPLMSSANVADMLPVYSPWLGQMTSPCPFKGYEGAPALMMGVTGEALNTPFAINLHFGDLAHTMILGPTGAGKSTLLATLVAQFMRYKDINIFAFDKGKSMYCLCKATHGRHYTPAGENSNLAFAPLNNLKTEKDRAWASEWLQAIAELNGIEVNPEMINQINETLKNMIDNQKRNPNYSITLSDFTNEIQDLDLREVLQQYLSGSALGNLIDAESDGLGDVNVALSVFEIEDLMNLQPKYCLPVLDYLFHVIENNLQGQPAVIVLDEAWLMLGNPVFARKIREWLKVLRKANCAVVMATQSLSDLEKSGIMDVLIESCPTKIFLPNENAVQEEAQKLYKKFGLNYSQIDAISRGIKKRDYFFLGDNGHHARMFQLALQKFTLAFVAVSDKDALAKIDELIEKFGENGWVDEYLKMKNLTYPQVTVSNF